MPAFKWASANVLMVLLPCLAGCGGGGGAGGAAASAWAAPSAASTGAFFDSPVQGLHYDTATQHGETDAQGGFRYLPGETVAFSMGALQLGAATAQAYLTPLDLAGTTDPTAARVNNMLVLLQSLDTDGNSSNGITLAPAVAALAPTGLRLDVAPSTFRANAAVTAWLASAVASTRVLVSDTQAQQHFQDSLNAAPGSGKINISPYAHAGPMQTVATGSTVTLDGRGSGDANGDALSYHWSLVSKPSGSAAVISAPGSATPSLVADVAGDYLLGLVVSDGTLASAIAIAKVSVVAQTGVPSAYVLVWSDEFNTSGSQMPDAAKWNYDTAQNKLGWFNNELQYYASARIQNAVVQNGSLTITARKENLATVVNDWGGQSYTSARLITKGLANWTYGFFEVRTKLPCGAGTWPAIWTLGSTVGVWPDQGEIDIMEQTGWDKGTVLGTVHTLAGFGGAGSTGSIAVPDACTAFHNYQIHWTVNAIDFLVDGKSYRPSYIRPANAAGWPFDQPQYLLLNVAVGGVLGGSVNDATLSATGMEVDYVRVYQAP